MFWGMIAFPPNKDVPATPQFSDSPLMLPATVTAVNCAQEGVGCGQSITFVERNTVIPPYLSLCVLQFLLALSPSNR